MGLPAARLGDTAGHGGAIIFGATTVLIGGMPAARIGDPLACPGFDGPKPHIMGNIMMASTTVIIGGAFAARQGDPTGCGAAGVSGASMPAVAGPPAPPAVPGNFSNEGVVAGHTGTPGPTTGTAGLLYGQHSGYHNADGDQDSVRGSVAHAGGTVTNADGSSMSGQADLYTGTAEVHAGSGGGGASASVAAAQGQVKVTDAQGNSSGASGGLLNANAGAEAVLGSDGRRTGMMLGLSAQASVAEGQLDHTEVYHIPFTEYTINVGQTVGGSFESVGGAASVGAYHDAADDRVHLAGMIDIEVVIGAKLGLDISFGRAASAGGGAGTPGVPVPLTPGTVILGCPTVLIG